MEWAVHFKGNKIQRRNHWKKKSENWLPSLSLPDYTLECAIKSWRHFQMRIQYTLQSHVTFWKTQHIFVFLNTETFTTKIISIFDSSHETSSSYLHLLSYIAPLIIVELLRIEPMYFILITSLIIRFHASLQLILSFINEAVTYVTAK